MSPSAPMPRPSRTAASTARGPDTPQPEHRHARQGNREKERRDVRAIEPVQREAGKHASDNQRQPGCRNRCGGDAGRNAAIREDRHDMRNGSVNGCGSKQHGQRSKPEAIISERFPDCQTFGVHDPGAVFRRPVPDEQGDGREADHEQQGAEGKIGFAPSVIGDEKVGVFRNHRGADTDACERNAERQTAPGIEPGRDRSPVSERRMPGSHETEKSVEQDEFGRTGAEQPSRSGGQREDDDGGKRDPSDADAIHQRCR